MLKQSLRLLIILPFGAVTAIATMANQSAPQGPRLDADPQLRQPIACSAQPTACIIGGQQR